MKEKSIFPLLISLALPMIISMMVSSLYNIIDSIFVARLGENTLAALSLVYPMQNLITSIAVGFGVGINAVIALYLGADKKEYADSTATQGMLLSIIHGVLLNIAGIFLMPNFLKLFTSDTEIIKLALQYSTIILNFSVIVMIGITFEKIFQSVGKMMVSMISMISGCIINIILDPLMIFGFGPIPAMGIQGAAYATGIGQLVTLLIYFIFYFKKTINIKISVKYLKPEKDICQKLYNIGIPASLNMALPSLLISALNSILSAFSPIYVVVLGVYYKLQTFIYLPANGIIQGMRPIMSYNYGAGEHKRVKEIFKVSLSLIAGLMCIGMVVCLAIPKQLIEMFSTNSETIKSGITALRIISIGFVISSLSVTLSGALEALGKGIHSLFISILRYVVIIIPIAFFLSRIYAEKGVWNAFWISEIICAFSSYLIYHKSIRTHLVT